MDYGNVACSNCGSKPSSKGITFKCGETVKIQMLRYECNRGVKDCRTLGEIECKPKPWSKRKPMVKREQWKTTWGVPKCSKGKSKTMKWLWNVTILYNIENLILLYKMERLVEVTLKKVHILSILDCYYRIFPLIYISYDSEGIT